MIEIPGLSRPQFAQVMRRARALIAYAIENPDTRIQVIPFDLGEGRGGIVLPAQCKRAKPQNMEPAVLALAVHDDVVKNVRGNEKLRDEYFLVRIPREVGQRFDSPIVLAGEVR